MTGLTLVRCDFMNELTGYQQHLQQRGMSSSTIRQRLDFASWRLREWSTLAVPAHVVTTWLGQFTGWTRHTYYWHLQCLFTWARHVGVVAVDPLADFRRPKRPRPRPKPLTERQVRDVLSDADGDLETFLQLGLLAGLRSHEIAKFHGHDIDEGSLFVRGKGGSEWLLPTHETLWRIAQRYPRDDYWFPSVQAKHVHVSKATVENKVRAQMRYHGINTGGIHRLRHTYGTNLADSGVPTHVVQKLMRHESIATTETYLGVNDAAQRAAIHVLGLAA